MFSLTFGLGSRKPKYFPETEMSVKIIEDITYCNIEDNSFKTIVYADDLTSNIFQDEIIIKIEEDL